MNQRSRQKATPDVKNYFYKLLSNLNFGIDCKSNIDSRTQEPLYDELGETAFIKKCDDMFDRRNYYQFADPDIMREEINKKFDRLTLILSKNDPWYEVQKESYDFCVDESVSIKSFAVKGKKAGEVDNKISVGKSANVCEAFFNELYLRHSRNILFSQ